MRIEPQQALKPIVVQCREKRSTIKETACAISHWGHARWVTMSTVRAIITGRTSTRLALAETLADITPTTDATITRVSAPTAIIRLTSNAIVTRAVCIPRLPVSILADITTTPPRWTQSVEPATTTVLTVPGSSLTDVTASWIVRLRVAVRRAGTLAVSTPTCQVAAITALQAATYIHIEHTTVSTTSSTVLGKHLHCIFSVIMLLLVIGAYRY